MTPYRPRRLATPLRRALADMPVAVVTGLRQSGKSTLLQRDPAFRLRNYISLDDQGALERARADPEVFVRSPEPLTIDEVQRCPELLIAIKREVDRNRRPGAYLLSGSANFALLRDVAESLAGRAAYFTLHPLSRREWTGHGEAVPFLKRMFESGKAPGNLQASPVPWADVLAGGFPAVRLGVVRDRAGWFDGYVQSYLERDVRDLARLPDLIPFRRLLRLASLRTGQLLRTSELARDAALNVMTALRYLHLMEASYVIRRVGPSLANRASRLIKAPKLYFTDSGLACHLAGLDRRGTLPDDPMSGAILETYVAQNLAEILSSSWGSRAELLFWSVQGRHEVDFVIEDGRDILAIEVKAAGRWHARDLVGLRAFLAQTPRCRAAILAFNGTTGGKIGDRLWAVPLNLLLS